MSHAYESTRTSAAPSTATNAIDRDAEALPPAHPYPGWQPTRAFDPSAARAAFGHWFDDVVPTAGDLRPGAGPPDLSHASSETLVHVIENHIQQVYAGYGRALASAVSALEEPPHTEEQLPFALKALALLAEGVAGMVLGRVGTALVGKLKDSFGDKVGDAAKDVFRNYGREGSKGIHDAVLGSAALPDLRAVDGSKPDAVNPAGSLVQEYEARQTNALGDSESNAKDRLLLLQEVIARVPPAALLELENALTASGDEQRWFQHQVVVGWLNFCSALSLGPRDRSAKAAMRGANGVHAYDNSDPEAMSVWRERHHGFVEVVIKVPDVIDGVRGLALESVHVDHDGPGAARVLRRTANSFGKLPVYRRITFSTGPTKLESSIAFVITPDGELELDGGNAVLAAIGRERPSANEHIYMIESHGDDAHPTAGAAVRADDARRGAKLVKSWLDKAYRPEKVQ